ncbi:hypothetical protein P3T27_003547 [Kitasatospora sp. MAA19]|uniref:DUF2398 family protein n=1 Tax=Kitasatospora sp. MAA19 TaxID=3035090 RepID=UPI0024739B55|nr:DUF2398 family protein [Kitasatospora sp. MAA19]MDH6706820.1 hypothetical protein [Kitasatospora sp. MAA19]
MEQQEYAVGATRVAAGRPDGRTGGTGRGTADAVLAVHEPAAEAAPEAVSGPRADAAQAPGPASDPVLSTDPVLSPDPGLLRLAHWFAAATPGTADDLCTAAFGLYPARHLGAPAEAASDAACDADVSWWHGPTAHATAAQRSREARTAGGLRRARRDASALPVVRSGAKPGRPGRHRKPERTRPVPGAQDRSDQDLPTPPAPVAGPGLPVAEVADVPEVPGLPAAERRIAARLLLAHPLVTASGPHADGFPLIRRHRDWLVERFDTLLGYRLVVGPWHARLCKAGLGPGAARRLEHPATGAPFTPAGYAQLALALALLVDAPEQLPYGRLLDAMRVAAPGLAAGPADRAMALAALADWQILGGLPTDRAEPADLVDPADPADPAVRTAVLTVDRELARAVPAGPPALAADAADLIHRAADAEPATAVRRLLAETPAVLAADLPADRRAWLHEHRLSGPAALADFLGLETELRAEGVALLDPADELTDLALPGAGTLPQATLLLLERLVEEVRPLPGETTTGGDVPIPDALIDGVLGDIADEYGLPAGWHRDYLADRTALRRDALDLLHRLGLITPTPRGTRPPGWLLRPPAARYAPAPDLRPAPGTGRHSRPAPAVPRPAGAREQRRA